MDKAGFDSAQWPKGWQKAYPEFGKKGHTEQWKLMQDLRQFRSMDLASQYAEGTHASLSKAATEQNSFRNPQSHAQERASLIEPLAAILGAGAGGPVGAGLGYGAGHLVHAMTREHVLHRGFRWLSGKYGEDMAGNKLIDKLVSGRRLPPEQQRHLQNILYQIRNGRIPWPPTWSHALAQILFQEGSDNQQKGTR